MLPEKLLKLTVKVKPVLLVVEAVPLVVLHHVHNVLPGLLHCLDDLV